MIVDIYRNEGTAPTRYVAVNAFTKENMYCVVTEKHEVHKYPLCSLIRVVEHPLTLEPFDLNEHAHKMKAFRDV